MTNTSALIRDYAAEHPVFGADEIRKLHGQKAALLVTRLAAKGQFVRLANGVFGLTEVEETHPDYLAYLQRMHEALLARAALPDASLSDRLFAWASQQDAFRIPDANMHFGRDMKDIVKAYSRQSKKIERISEGVFRYAGYRPANRRTNAPLAAAENPHVECVYTLIAGCVYTAAELSARTGIDANEMLTILLRLTKDGRLKQWGQLSTGSHQFYHRPDSPPTRSEDHAHQCLLAMIAAAGQWTTRTASDQGITDALGHMQLMMVTGLIKPSNDDAGRNGRAYSVTPDGLAFLRARGFGIDGTQPIMHRPFEREILIHVLDDATSYAALKDRTRGRYTSSQTELAVGRLAKAGAITISNTRPAHIAVTEAGKRCFARPEDQRKVA